MFLELVVTFLVGLFSAWAFVFWKKYRYIKHLPSPKVLPLLGNALEFGSTKDVLDKLTLLYKNLNTKTLRIHIGFRTFIQTKDYKLVEFLLKSQTILSKGVGYDFLHSWLGLGLLTSDGERWRTHRRLITPTFHFQILEQFIEVFNAKGSVMVEKLKKEVGKESVDVFPYVTLCALDIICETAMGTFVNAQSEESSHYAKCVKDMGHIIQERSLTPHLHSNLIYKFSDLYRQERAALGVLHGYTNSVIQKRREQLSNKDTISDVVEDFGRKKRIAFLDMLLQANVDGQPLSDSDIREEVDTFMFEGHDTTAAGICYALFCLANNPECQEKAVEELYGIFGDDKSRECTYQDLQDMKYLDLVIKETLRLYPSVPIIARKTSNNVNYDGWVIPKDLTIGINIFGIQRDPDYFTNPDKFDPERFAPGNYDGTQPFAFVPFSAGPRNCIGQKFATLEMKSTISKVLRNFKLVPATPIHNLQIAAESILKAVNGVKISIQERIFNTK